MQTHEYAILAYVLGAVLIAAEVLLPTHGLVGIVGVVGILVSVGFCFAINAWIGLGVLAATLAATPFAFVLAMRIFPRTPFGRKLVLPPVHDEAPPALVQIGQTGVTVSELRPMGTCEFSGTRVEALSDRGIIAPGQKVQVVNLNNRRPTVRVVVTTT
jgi:membrane-bound ClpP family serine protease